MMRRYQRQYEPRDRVERMKLFVLSCAAAIFVIGFVGLLIAIAFLTIKIKPALSEELYRVPSVCKPLANRYGIPDRVTADDAEKLVAQLDQYSLWPGVKQCRKAVKQEWKL